MKTYTQMGTLAQSLASNTNSTTLTLLQQFINDGIRTIYNIRGGKWWFLEDTVDIATVAGQRSYQVPDKFRKIMDVYVTVGSTIYMPEPVFDPYHWKLILAYQMGTSDIPYFYYRDGNKIHFAPIPATNDNTITIRGRVATPDLNIADVTNITVTSITNGASAMVVSGSLTQDFVGRFIRITETSAANGGDGRWYEIGTVVDATHLTLLKPYAGTTITAGSAASTIGQVSRIPEAYDIAPVYRAVALYYEQQSDDARATRYWKLYDGGQEAGILPPGSEPGGLIGQMIQNETETMEGAYIPPFASTSNIVNTGAWWSPWQGDASGF